MFGKAEPRENDLVRRCIRGENEQFPQTNIVQKNLEDFRDFNSQHIAKPANLGQTAVLNDPTMVFGQTKKVDEWDVGKCIKGDATYEEAYNDPELGRSTKIGLRNVPRPGDEGRYFGTPSIRDDVVKPQLKSLASTQVLKNIMLELW